MTKPWPHQHTATHPTAAAVLSTAVPLCYGGHQQLQRRIRPSTATSISSSPTCSCGRGCGSSSGRRRRSCCFCCCNCRNRGACCCLLKGPLLLQLAWLCYWQLPEAVAGWAAAGAQPALWQHIRATGVGGWVSGWVARCRSMLWAT